MFNVLVILCYFVVLGCLLGFIDKFLFPEDCPKCEQDNEHAHTD